MIITEVCFGITTIIAGPENYLTNPAIWSDKLNCIVQKLSKSVQTLAKNGRCLTIISGSVINSNNDDYSDDNGVPLIAVVVDGGWSN